ncbi:MULTISPECIES: Rrf2 family transcriptional regulator [unclassified Mesorhizobium]|uniref:Rrf2 family transcriptional regulator n=1 Tax=unclassified Mesorhizobium TaxID=325217 RepID=UPI0024151D35|nr:MULTISPECIES: Rrf2 family transcriptional regulator [unclassified Mesorhizobium]MDG4889927.1 Rrf2 family transcriptional regulator [Mesorhizobium sp. WSM4887]MDG4904070.1 Rrf2 family transcriptional regulator [Mesorhizobium sp. WSM4962]MDG4909097.1 Rrf2 family transcriptional regulator [Mesorhizobium sp. WSM4898]MDG4921721.1 Rrf2 family transcriptional regulator [Mesorhizobium sp. WSM4989]
MNTRFAVATHILTFLQSQEGSPASSELIALSVNTNPTLIRRLLSQLAKAGLTTSQMGSGGGALLARAGSSITLLDVHKAIDEDVVIFPLHQEPNPQCPVGRHINKVLQGHIADMEQAMERELARTTLADLASDISTINSAA